LGKSPHGDCCYSEMLSQGQPSVETLPEARGPLDEIPPDALFGGVSGDAWRWLHLEGRALCPFLDRYLPGLTGDPDFEAQVVGLSGIEALSQGFQIYELFKALHEEHAAKPLTSASRVLDFGCGWGRVIRFFLKDVAPENLIGIDCSEKAIARCLETNRWCRFELCEVLPPTDLEADGFDFIYAFSVFSHLSEEAHERWLEEFERLLRSGGLLIVTTFERAFLSSSSDGSDLTNQPLSLEEWFSLYDRGDFCHRRLKAVPNPHFGDTFIPERYVREHWTKHFIVQDYVGAPDLDQNIIVCTKR
jgi:SAM-dependent methyltransferase